jgi:hypothetical protein
LIRWGHRRDIKELTVNTHLIEIHGKEGRGNLRCGLAAIHSRATKLMNPEPSAFLDVPYHTT